MNNKFVFFAEIQQLKSSKLLTNKYYIHNQCAKLAKFLNIYKPVAGNLINNKNIPRRRRAILTFSDLDIIALNMISEAANIDSKSLLFAKLQKLRVRSLTLYPVDKAMTQIAK